MKLQLLVPLITYQAQADNSAKLTDSIASVATRLDADIQALVLVPEFPPVSSALGNLLLDVPSMVREVKASSRARAKALLQTIEQAFAAKRLQVRTAETECYPAEFGAIASVHARYHDLAVLDVGASESAPGIAEAIIFGSGKPTLLISDKVDVTKLDHVMIAWDETRAAARAVADAGIFLERAAKVTIVTVTEEKTLPNDNPNVRLAEYFSRRGIAAQALSVGGGLLTPIEQLLQGKAKEIGAGLLVMGGFGHSRMRDFVLGGATNGVLKNLQMPVLLSH